MDSENSIQILGLLKRLSKEKLVIVVTHEREYAERFGDRIIELSDGQVLRDTFKAEFEKSINEENIGYQPNEESDDYLGPKKSSLPFVYSFKLGLHGLRYKIFRLIMTILLSFIAFTLFGISDTIASYDKTNAILNSHYDLKRNYISFHKERIVSNDEGESRYKFNMNEDDLSLLEAKFPGYRFHPVINQYDNNLYGYLYGFDMSLFDPKIYGIMELTEEVAQHFGLRLLVGEMPVKTDDDVEEVLVSDHFYKLFKKYGYNDWDSKVDINCYDDLIGKSIRLQDVNYVISGILDTGFDEMRYLSTGSDELSPGLLQNEYNRICNYGLSNILFVRDGYYNDVINKPEYEGTYLLLGGKQEEVTLYFEEEPITNRIHPVHSSYDSISVHIGNPNRIYWKDGIERTTLTDNEVIISINSIYYKDIGTIGSLQDHHRNRIRETG